MSKKRVDNSYRYKVGDIIGNNDLEDRIILLVDHKKQEYSIGFTDDPAKTVYKWKMNDAHRTYELIPPSYIPVEQRERYRELNGRYKSMLCESWL